MSEVFKLVQSESGDFFVIPESVSIEDFIEAEYLGEDTSYATYVGLNNLVFSNWSKRV